LGLYAQQPKFTASTNSAIIGIGGSTQIVYTLVNGTSEGFQRPNFNGFTVTGSQKSSGGNMTLIVNGQVVQSGGEEKWIYQISGSKVGKYTVEPAKVKVKGQWLSSNSLTIEVSAKPPANKQNQGNNSGNGSVSANDVFVKASLTKSNPYQGEQTTISYKIYTRIPISQYAINKLASYTGFWTYDLIKDKDQPKQYSETVNGEKYMVAEIRKVALFPQKSGRLTIEPLEVECLAQVRVKSRKDPFDDFFNDPFFSNQFGSSYQNVKKTLKSNSIVVNVKPLPTNNAPDDFNGAVGSFTIKSEIDRTELKSNEAVTLKITISGKGNLSLIDKINTEFPTDFEVYDPKINDNISTTGGEISGTRTFEYLIIPRNPGVFTLKPIQFSYFDLAKGVYNTLSTQGYTLKVGKGTGNSGGVYSSAAKEDIKYIGSDIRFIYVKDNSLNKTGYFFFNSWLYYLLLLLPIVIFIVIIVVWRKQMNLRSNQALLKHKKATKVALKRLKTAEEFLKQNNKDNFYIEISKALWGYCSDKFSIPVSNLSVENISEKLKEKNISEEVINNFITTINNCEYARFAPLDESVSLQKIYDDSVSIISKLEQNLK